MRSIAQINNQLTHLPHIQQLSCLNCRLAGSHVQHLLPQIAAIDITHFPQHFADSIDKIFSSICLDIRRQTAHAQQTFAGTGSIHTQSKEFVPVLDRKSVV